jgi:hypothetical protein
MTRVLRSGRDKLSGKGIASAVKQVDPLRQQPAARPRAMTIQDSRECARARAWSPPQGICKLPAEP